MVEFSLLVLSSVANVILGLFVYFKNSRSATNRLFLLLTSSFAAWSVASYVSVNPLIFPQITWVRLVLFCASLLCLSVYLTFTVFPDNAWKLTLINKIAMVYTLFVMVLTLTPAIFILNEKNQPVPNVGIPLFTILALSLLGGGIFNLVKKYKHAKGVRRSQLEIIILGVVGSFSLILLTNLLLVIAFDVHEFISFAPAFTLIFSSSMAYTIIKHKLFDIRAAVARSVAYVLSLGLLAIAYASITSSIANEIFSGVASDTVLLIINTLGFLIAVLAYPYIKKFFDKTTNKLFYRDAYDAQVFLDQLNRILVVNVELEKLLEQASKVIEENLKAEYCLFWIHTTYFPRRTIGVSRRRLPEDDVDEIRALTPFMDKNVIVTDELSESEKVYPLLSKNNVGVLAPIKFKNSKAGVGHLVLGQKKSGNPYSSQDIKLIGIIANELVIATQNALRFDEIERFNITLQEKVDDATKQLRHTNERLRLLDQTKDDFISMASHQLRTPLTSVKGYLSMVLEGDAGKLNEQERKLLNQAFFSSQRMVYLIGDLLNVSRLKTGKFIIEPTQVNLAEVVQGEIEQLVETAASRNLKLTYKKPHDFPTLMFDETKIRQVIMNFTDNAIHYTPSGGHVQVELKETPQTIEFTVTDDGIGVSRHEQHHLFSKFFRAGNAKKARPDGTGLGLFMAKKVIIAQGGSIIFKSQEGKGSTFGFTFAKAKLLPAKISDHKPEAEKAAAAAE